jgi:hypothetical protein
MLESYHPTTELKAIERLRLIELELVVEQGLQTFYEVGKALEEIRAQKLYRETDPTFEAYCRNKWNIARRTAYQLIDAAKVMENLAEIEGKKPTKESQVRPLAKLDPELQIKVWEEALEMATNGKPTGASIKRLVDKHLSSEGESTKPSSKNGYSDLDRLRLENQELKERLKQNDVERERRAAEVAKELERLRAENRQLKAELRQRDIDWESRLAVERTKIREEIRGEYEGQINTLTSQVTTLTQQLADMTAKYEAVLARLETIEKGK